MGDTLFQRCFIRSMIFLRMVIVSVFVFTPATNDHHFHVKWTSNPKVAANPSHGTVVISLIDGKGTDMREFQACIPCLIRSSVATVVIQTSRLATSDLDFQWPLVYPPNMIAYHLHLPIVFTKSSDQRFSFCIIPILLNRDGCPYLGFVSGVISHRRYLRSRTDEASPHGDVIWVFDPGISKLPVSLEGIGFRTHRIGLRLPMTWPADDILTFYRWLIRLFFMKGEGMVTNSCRPLSDCNFEFRNATLWILPTKNSTLLELPSSVYLLQLEQSWGRRPFIILCVWIGIPSSKERAKVTIFLLLSSQRFHYVVFYISGLQIDTLCLKLRFAKIKFSLVMLHSNRLREKSNLKLENSSFSEWKASLHSTVFF